MSRSSTSVVDVSVDVRGPRFAAWVTSAVLVLALLLGSGWLVGAQGVVFAVGAFAGIRRAPYALLFRVLVAPRLGPAREREPEAPLRFAQLVGLLFRLLIAPRLGPVREREPEPPLRFAQLVGFVFAVIGAAGYLLGAPVVGAVATGFALVAALLNAAVGFCLGCELHLLLRRALPARTA